MRTGRGVAGLDPRLALAGGAALFGLGSLALGAAWVFGGCDGRRDGVYAVGVAAGLSRSLPPTLLVAGATSIPP